MSIAESMVQELQLEAGLTRKLLERVPEEHFDWKPHKKSMSMGALASHLAEGLQWGVATARTDELEFDPAQYVPFKAKTQAELLQTFDASLKEAMEALLGVSDEAMFQQWKMINQGTVIFEMPRIATVRNMILNHMIHHRGQLTVYLRMHDVPLPSIYGPSADEQPAWAGA